MSRALLAWLRKPSARLVDAAVAVAVGLALLSAWLANPDEDHGALLGLLFAVAGSAPLLVRRRWPFAALVVVAAVAVAARDEASISLPLLILVYTVGYMRSWPATSLAAGIAIGAYTIAQGTEDLIGAILYCALVGALGLYAGSRRATMEALSEHAERLDRERALLADMAVAEERVRIARELHDVVAHSVSLMVVQSQALGATVRDERVGEATKTIAVLGRQAMTEMKRTLKLLRSDDDAASGRDPQPGLGDLEELLERARAAGVRVEIVVEGEPRPLSETLDLSAYRIVQEALTNVVKHAGRAATTVTLGYRTDELELSIVDKGNGASAVNGAGGHGLVGMRERAALFGGTLTAEPQRDGGFAVRGVLPYGDGA